MKRTKLRERERVILRKRKELGLTNIYIYIKGCRQLTLANPNGFCIINPNIIDTILIIQLRSWIMFDYIDAISPRKLNREGITLNLYRRNVN
jgi:hypothetical protein